ncbi:hypothetical protein [Anatilimnocola floriformis]|uniref:hypothetical protein n=1 Tax=Anatilimnocola floriformis TaxID=2948575 RepID=UPI0020C38544|nr:hypothetical protein [Anatilimnocola floriformis]
MIAQTPEERYQYQARLKAERDQRWNLKMATEQGREEGERKGLARHIRMMQGVLKLPQTSQEELTAMELSSLSKLCDDLEGKLPPASA